MSWQWTPLMIPLLAASVLSIALAVYVLNQRRHRAQSRTGALILVAGAWWCFGYAMELGSPSLGAKVFWAKAQYPGINLVPIAWLVHALQYTGREKWVTFRTLAPLSIVPILSVLLTFTNDAHGLVWSSVHLDTRLPTSMLAQTFNVWFWVMLTYSNVVVLGGFAIFMQMFVQSRLLYRRQIMVLLFAGTIVGLASVLGPVGLNPVPHLDLEPFAFGIAGPIVAWGLFFLRLGDIGPVAHQSIIEGILDGIVVLDEQDRILEVNRAAQALIGCAASAVIGMPIQEAWPAWQAQERRLHDTSGEMVLGKGDRKQCYDVRVSSLEGARGQLVGRVLILRDVTERTQAQEALQALNAELESRVLARTAELDRVNTELVREVDERIQAEESLLQRNRALLSLQAAATATASSLDLPFVLDTVTWEMTDMLAVEDCVIYEWDQEKDTLSILARYGFSNPGEGTPQGQTIRLADYALRKSVLSERYAQQVSIGMAAAGSGEAAYMHEAGTRSLLMLPMVFQDRVVGLVEMIEGRSERVFTDQEISLAQLLANQAASAIENARLYERAQQEIAERMSVEEQIKASLEEKVILLKEIHHRVKNNLQVISSLLNLQARTVEDPETLEVLRDSRNRVRSMALIHEKIYRSHDLAKVDFADYIQNLASFLIRSYRSQSASVALTVDADGVFLAIDIAVPCGLIINELISNALKHAFADGRTGEIQVTLRPNGNQHMTLTVSDNGVGFPAELDFRETDSLGLQLVNTLVRQIDGTIELHRDGGTRFEIAFAVS
jgi:PAS domain S-box-containing protein